MAAVLQRRRLPGTRRRFTDDPGKSQTVSEKIHDLDVRPITYIEYQEAPPFTNDMAPLFHKRLGFRADQEVRLLKFNEEQFTALTPKDASVRQLDEYIYLPWVLKDAIDKIFISPYADEDYEQRVRDAVSLSETHTLKYWWCSPPRTGIARVRPRPPCSPAARECQTRTSAGALTHRPPTRTSLECYLEWVALSSSSVYGPAPHA